MYGFKLSILYSLNCLLSFKLIVPPDAANNFVMAAKLELFVASTMVKPASGFEVVPEVDCWLLSDDDDDDDENVLETTTLAEDGPPLVCAAAALVVVGDESWRVTAGVVLPPAMLPEFVDEIVSSKELNLVKFIIQPSTLRSSFSSAIFCHETFNVVEDTASTMTSSGCPGRVVIPSATPA